MTGSPGAEPTGTAGGGRKPARREGDVLLGRGYQGAVYRISTPDGPMIAKQAIGGRLAYSVRLAMLRREHGIYRLLEGITGVPRCFGLRDGELLLELVEGRSLRDVRQTPAERERFFGALLQLIEAVHRAGVAHGDLKRKDNILVGIDGRPFLIDFGTAVSAPASAGALRRFIYRQVCRMDLNAWVKLKYQRTGGAIAPEDAARFRPTLSEQLARVVRRAWRSLTLRRRRRSRRKGS